VVRETDYRLGIREATKNTASTSTMPNGTGAFLAGC
jgi:hypothetical protein